MSQSNEFKGPNHGNTQEGIRIDIKRIAYRAIQYWYIIVLTLGVSLAIAVFKTRYAPRIYPVTASIVIKENEETSEGRILYNNPLVSGFRNYLNELYIIRSYPLVQQTLTSLNFGAAFYHEGNVLTTEAYNIGIEGRIINDGGKSVSSVHFKILNEKEFRLTAVEHEDDSTITADFNFGDTIAFNDVTAVFLNKNREFKESIGKTYLFTYTNPALLTGSYVSKLRAAWAEEGSGVVNLAVDGTNPSKEIDFLKGLIAQYQQYDLDKKNQAATRTIDFITDQLTGISDSLHRVERQLERFKNNSVMMSLSSEAERLYAKLEPLEAQRVELVIRKNYYKYLSDYIQRENFDQSILPSSVGIDDPILTSLMSKMIELQMQIKMSTKLESPLVAETKRKITEIKRDIVESVNNQKSTDKIKQDYLDKQIRELEKQLKFLPLAERQLVSIQRNYSLLENLYIFLLQKKAEAGISKASTTTDIGIVDPPMQAGGAIYPKPFNNYGLAVFIGLGLPILLFVLMEIFNTKVQSKEDVEKVTSIPFIGGVGHKRSENNLEVLTAPKSVIAESFRALRSNLTFFLGQHERAVFLITSSISGEGKTFTTINLASVFALSGKKTLIVGADMRRPKIYQDFNLSNDVGLSTFLAGISPFEKVIQRTVNPCLDLISGGPVPPNPSELLLTSRMDAFLEEAKKHYDYIIIDTPPLAIVTDAFVLSKYADHTLFLIRQNYTPKALIRTTNDFYVSGKLQKISIVLNDIYKTGPGYGYGYGYGHGYGYGYGYVYGGKKRDNGYGYYSES